MTLGLLVWGVVLGCAPPPLADDGLPSVQILFPQSRTDIVVCPDLVVVVGIDNYEIGDPDEQGPGHWHLKDASGTYQMASSEAWLPYSFGPASAFPEPVPTSLSAVLAEFDHTELNTAVYPDATATSEFYVGATEDCIGSVGDAGDTDTDTGFGGGQDSGR